jgi:signal transduction histidine kinase
VDRWEEMKQYVDFGARDGALLVAFQPVAQPHFRPIVEHFYETAQRFPDAQAVFVDSAQVERLKATLVVWLDQLLGGVYDHEYYERRLRIGRVHVRVGLPERFVFLAMNQLRRDLMDVARRDLTSDVAWSTCHALTRLIDLELAVMSATYLEAHEEVQLSSLRDLIVRHLPVTVLCLDAHGRVSSATRPSDRLFGNAEATGQHFEAFLPVELIDAADLHTELGRALSTGHELTLPRVTLGKGPLARTFRISIVPLEHPLARILLAVEELTDAVQTEARLQQAESLARIGGLAANVAHEIRNPLAAISATLQVISGTLDADDRRRPILIKVHEQVLRLDRLVNDLMGYARPAVAKSVPTHLLPVAHDALKVAGVQASAVDDGASQALCDRELLSQILVNLLQNARDAAGPAGRVAVVVGPGPSITVADDGPGIAPEVRAHLFEAFVTTKAKGTGLGLAICRKLAEAQGGSLELLEVQSGGGGAAFRLTLPAA